MVTLQEFIETIFVDAPEDERVCLSAMHGDKWADCAASARRFVAIDRNPGSWYFCISTVAAAAEHMTRGRDACRCVYALVLDDVGTKAAAPPVEPSYKIETSAGNFQWGYLLEPTSDFDLHERTFTALADAGYTDRGAFGVYRVARVPGSVNTKRGGFVARVTEWHPERAWTLESLALDMGVKVKPARPASVRAVNAVPEGSMLEQLTTLGIVKGPLGGGKHDITCPWVHEHTDGVDGGTCYFEPDEKYPTGGLKCLHEHCAGKGIRDLKAWVAGRQQQRAEQRAENARIGGGGDLDTTPVQLDLEQMHERMAYVEAGSMVFDVERPRHLLPLASWQTALCCNRTAVPVGDKVKHVPTTSLWLQSPARRTVASVTFAAGQGAFCLDPRGFTCGNMWSGWNWPVVDDAAVEARGAGLFVKHVEWLFGGRADDFLDWLAHLIQKPGELPHTAWLHVSPYQGTGRNWMAGVLARLTQGYCAASLDLVKLLDSQFNQVLSGKVMAIVDEIRASGQQWSHAQKLKAMINEATRQINAKHQAPYVEFNACRWLLFSNHRSALPLGDDDRRFETVICDKAPLEAAYYQRLYAALKDPAFIVAVGRFLLSRDISSFDCGAPAWMDPVKQMLIDNMQAPELVELKEAMSNYPYKLITGAALAARAELEPGAKTAAAFGHVIEDAGWVRVGRFQQPSGKKATVYCRRCDAVQFTGASQRVLKTWLPVADGGDAVPAIGPVE